MKVPKTFVLEEFKEFNLKYLNTPVKDIESLIMEDSFVDCDKRNIEELNTASPFSINLGINWRSVEKVVHVKYTRSANANLTQSIKFLQYCSKNCLKDDLESLFDMGTKFYMSKRKFTDRFLFKDRISMYLDGSPEFINKLVDHYRMLGFKQLTYRIEVV